MPHPTSLQVQKVIDNFRSALPLATLKRHIDMTENRVCSWNYKAGTVHCHAGWYVVGSYRLNKRRMSLFSYFKLLNTKGYRYGKYGIDFMKGIELIENDLGLFDVRGWAKDNPEIWCNRFGSRMFSPNGDILAFRSKKRSNSANTLQDIINHWEEVRDRLISLENQVEISDPPLTVEDLIERPDQHLVNYLLK